MVTTTPVMLTGSVNIDVSELLIFSHSHSEHREKRSTRKEPVSIDDYKFEG